MTIATMPPTTAMPAIVQTSTETAMNVLPNSNTSPRMMLSAPRTPGPQPPPRNPSTSDMMPMTMPATPNSQTSVAGTRAAAHRGLRTMANPHSTPSSPPIRCQPQLLPPPVNTRTSSKMP